MWSSNGLIVAFLSAKFPCISWNKEARGSTTPKMTSKKTKHNSGVWNSQRPQDVSPCKIGSQTHSQDMSQLLGFFSSIHRLFLVKPAPQRSHPRVDRLSCRICKHLRGCLTPSSTIPFGNSIGSEVSPYMGSGFKDVRAISENNCQVQCQVAKNRK